MLPYLALLERMVFASLTTVVGDILVAFFHHKDHVGPPEMPWRHTNTGTLFGSGRARKMPVNIVEDGLLSDLQRAAFLHALQVCSKRAMRNIILCLINSPSRSTKQVT